MNKTFKILKLWEVCNFDRRFNGVSKEKQETILNYKHISAKALKEYTNEQNGIVRLLSTGNYEGYTKLNLEDKNINKGEVISIPTGGTASIKYHNGYFIDSGNILFSSSDDSKYNAKYIYYYLLDINYKIQLFFRGAGVQHPSMPDIIEFDIPIPSLDVQNEIVEVLDKFTDLEADLEAELEARTKQYEYYLEQILYDGLEKYGNTKIEDIMTDVFRGQGIKRDEVSKDGIPCVRYGEIYTSYMIHFNETISYTNIETKKHFGNNDVLFAITGEKVEEIGKSIVYTGNEICAAGGDIVVLKHNQNGKYLSYMLSTYSLQRQKSFGKVKSKVVHMSANDIKKLELPIPPLDEQERIVSILDKFSSLVNDIKEGLPAEIELRRKQYEYYRNKLLTFN